MTNINNKPKEKIYKENIISQFKELLLLPINQFTDELNEQENLIHKTDDKRGITLLFLAVKNQLKQQVTALLDKGADPNKQNIFGETALHVAVETLNHKIINLLLEKDADPNIQQQYGETAMHFAARKGDYKVLKLLMLYYGDYDKKTNDGLKPIDYAREYNNNKCVQVIEEERMKRENEEKNYNERHFQNDEIKQNGLITKPIHSDQKNKTNNFDMKRLEEYDYVQFAQVNQHHNNKLERKSFNPPHTDISSLKTGHFVRNYLEDENGLDNLNRSILILENINPSYYSPEIDYISDNSKIPAYISFKSTKEPTNYLHGDLLFTYESHKNNIERGELKRTTSLKRSISPNVLKNSIRQLTRSFFEETLGNKNEYEGIMFEQSNDNIAIYNMLKQANMEKYITLFINEGFDLSLFIGPKSYITDTHLKQIGIDLPGHRARILIKIEQESKRLTVKINEDAVYYLSDGNVSDYDSDPYLYSIYQWLNKNKLEEYYKDFVYKGYHSIELLMMQMISSNPLSDEIIKTELNIGKIGHRIRIINQLNDDAQNYMNNLSVHDSTKYDCGSGRKNECGCVIY